MPGVGFACGYLGTSGTVCTGGQGACSPSRIISGQELAKPRTSVLIGNGGDSQEFGAETAIRIEQGVVGREGGKVALDSRDIATGDRASKCLRKPGGKDVARGANKERRECGAGSLLREASERPCPRGEAHERDGIVGGENGGSVVEGTVDALQPHRSGTEAPGRVEQENDRAIVAFDAAGDALEAGKAWGSRWEGLERVEAANSRAGRLRGCEHIKAQSATTVDGNVVRAPGDRGGDLRNE